ncbi:hypothetical protein N7541_001260 [Penicillium brevicompactum]|uniref:Altered inheritance of mitochondria protein 9, mitochondrial n=1 Tax=Penicillium brevicompactum TaxID=5074 RepID=A0A9W9RXT2_PENBR|nr:hypothetical protein N7541_001260 [Penicillium brevicompactum]
MRALRKVFRPQALHRSLVSSISKRHLSITSRGNPISKEELFKYTNGQFLSDEDRQLSKRYIRFDVDRLCDVIASIPGAGATQVSKIEKMEGGFSKALLVTTADGSEYIVKIPCPNAGRPMYCTASEVAVLAWSASSTNPVGAEYIVMERVPGVQIFKKWGEMGESNRLSIIKRLTQWERELAGIRFPAFGSLYHKSSLHGSLGEHDLISLDQSVDPEGLFCIGPSCDSAWSMQHSPSVHCGPWKTTSDLGESLLNRSLLRSQHGPNTDLPASLNSPLEEHSITLDMAKKVMPAVANNPELLAQSQPTLWHTDLHMGNIFVDEDNPAEVTGFIDWQHASINPLFLQVRWPIFLTPPEDYQEGMVLPQLPPDYEDMDADDKEIALYNNKKATWAKAYEVASFLNDRPAWRAMQVPSPLKEFFRRGDTWAEGILPLRETLVELFRSQQDLGFTESLLLNFNDEQIAAHEKEFEVCQEWHDMRNFVKKYLDTDDEGWVSPEYDFTEIQSRNKVLFDYYVSKSGLNRTPDEVRGLWPFVI